MGISVNGPVHVPAVSNAPVHARSASSGAYGTKNARREDGMAPLFSPSILRAICPAGVSLAPRDQSDVEALVLICLDVILFQR